MEKNKNGRDWAPVEQNIASLELYSKTECLATCTEETSHTTNNLTIQITEQQQSCLWKKRKELQPTKIHHANGLLKGEQLLFQSFYCHSGNVHQEHT